MKDLANYGIETYAAKFDRTEQMISTAMYKEKIHMGCLVADKYLNQRYLDNYNSRKVIDLNSKDENHSRIKIYRVNKIVYDLKEQINDKLISIFSSIHNINSPIAFVIESDGNKCTFYIVTSEGIGSDLAGETLTATLKGNFPGIEISDLIKGEEREYILKNAFCGNYCDINSLATVSLVPSERDTDKDKFIQGIEKFLNSMINEAYTAIFLAVPVEANKLAERKRGFEALYSNLSPHAKLNFSYSTNEAKSINESISSSFTDAINSSVSKSNGTSESSSSGTNSGSSSGFSFGGGDGSSFSSGSSSGSFSSYTTGVNFSESISNGSSKSKTQGVTDTNGFTKGKTDTTTINYENKSIAALLDKASQELKRIDFSEAYGMWDFCAYFYSNDISVTTRAANIYKSLMMGHESSIEKAHVNVWYQKEEIDKILKYINNLRHPVAEIYDNDTKERILATPTNMVNGKEIPIVLSFPRKSVNGFAVIDMAEFGRSVVFENNKCQKVISIGHIYHMGITEEKNSVPLDLNLLSSHCFITGSSGSGKSYTTYKLLDSLLAEGIKMMVIEPVKGEYKQIYGNMPNINIYSTDHNLYRMLRINPFQFIEPIHVLAHIEKLMQIFNASWELYAAMPAILKEAVVQAYIECGWDVNNSIYIGNNKKGKYPVFKDILEILPKIINDSDYSSDAKGDYKGALVTRVKSMTTGITGIIFERSEGIADDILFDSNVIVDLSEIGSNETIALIMGILIMKLGEYRQAIRKLSVINELNSDLRHVTVLEEAHNLLKRCNKEQSQEGANIVGKSVEMISNSIKEMRTYGEGFIIIDQSPMAVDTAAIENTSTKIIMNTPARDACEELSSALSLNEDQSKELARLSTGVAAVFQKGWLTPVLMKVDKWKESSITLRKLNINDIKALRGNLVVELCKQYSEKKYSLLPLNSIINKSILSNDQKEVYKEILDRLKNTLQEKRNLELKDFYNFTIEICSCKEIFNVLKLNGIFSINMSNYIVNKNNVSEEVLYNEIKKKAVKWKGDFIKALKLYILVEKTNEKTTDLLIEYWLGYLSTIGEYDDNPYVMLHTTLYK